jgi:hypothetical protein
MSRVCEPLNPPEAHELQPWVAHSHVRCMRDRGNRTNKGKEDTRFLPTLNGLGFLAQLL